MQSVHEILSEYWGHTSFRPLQEDIINSVLDGYDVLALLPTGGGKSICFQVPAMQQEGICLVISPLIALMKDQVENLKKKGIPALSVYSGMSFVEVRKTLQNAAFGNYKFLYVSPERIETNLFLEFLPLMKISLVAIDEAHCISQWGYDFRPPYVRIAALRTHLPGIPFLALTASATLVVQNDICEKLGFNEKSLRFQQSFERANLSYSVFNVGSKQHKLLEILNNVKGSALVYCKSRKHTRDIAELLKLNKINADFYHAGLVSADRNRRQEDWINNRTRVIACTNAFGMGIDKPDVRTVVHYGVPDCLENYYQEAGRAGRDGKKAYAVLLYNDRELDELQQQPAIRYPGKDQIKAVYTAIMNHLQVAAGMGEESSFDFDLAAFTKAFKLDPLSTSYAIKALEQEGLLQFNEVFFKPSTIVFTVDKSSLQDFEQQHPPLEPTLKGLLRSYEGIFDYPASINEGELARFIGKPVASLIQDLNQLKQYGIIAYSPLKETPQLTLILNRMYADSFTINLDNYLLRKKNFEERIKAMTDFVKDSLTCRSQLIATYFNDHSVKACGICDTCLDRKSLDLDKEEFQQISEFIFKEIEAIYLPITQLLERGGRFRKEKIWKVINYLQAEEKLAVTKEGELFKRKRP